jgi:hypothetical protein
MTKMPLKRINFQCNSKFFRWKVNEQQATPLTFLNDKKSILLKTIYLYLKIYETLYCYIWLFNLHSFQNIYSICDRKPKVSKAKGINVCWLSEHVLSCLAISLNATLMTTRTRSCLYLKSGSSQQWTVCSSNLSGHAF